MTGIVFGESPRWRDGRLWFSDWGAGRVLSVAGDGVSKVEAEVDSFPMCIDFLPDGRLLIVSSADRQVLRREADGSLALHAELAGVSDKPWNDIVVDGRGNAYVNSIGFEFPEEEFAPGIVVLVKPDGRVTPVADGLAFPNGMAVTADNATLIVAESYAEQLTAFDIADDGTLSKRRIWAATPGDHPDGICLDVDGAAWYADVGDRHCVRVREGGEVLTTVDLDRGAFACALSRETEPRCTWWARTGVDPMRSAAQPGRWCRSSHHHPALATRDSAAPIGRQGINWRSRPSQPLRSAWRELWRRTAVSARRSPPDSSRCLLQSEAPLSAPLWHRTMRPIATQTCSIDPGWAS